MPRQVAYSGRGPEPPLVPTPRLLMLRSAVKSLRKQPQLLVLPTLRLPAGISTTVPQSQRHGQIVLLLPRWYGPITVRRPKRFPVRSSRFATRRIYRTCPDNASLERLASSTESLMGQGKRGDTLHVPAQTVI